MHPPGRREGRQEVGWEPPTAGDVNQVRPHSRVRPRVESPVQGAYLAHGLIFRASPRLMQKPAPPVANQKCTGRWRGER